MAVSGHDLRQSLEAAIAAKYSALWGSVPLSLPLEDRSLTLYPTPTGGLAAILLGTPSVYSAHSKLLAGKREHPVRGIRGTRDSFQQLKESLCIAGQF